jgi:hypothetical protein
MPQFESVLVNAEVRGKSQRITMWPYGDQPQGVLKELHYTVNRSASVVRQYDTLRSQIEQDGRLSDAAKREDVQRTAALPQLAALAVAHKNLRNEAEALDARRSALIEVKQYAPGDSATVAIDLALAAQLRDMNDAGRMQAMQQDPRLAEVVARLPSTLTGIREGLKQAILSDAASKMNPAEAAELQTLSEALRYANEGITNAARTIARDAGLTSEQFAPFAHIVSGSAEPATDVPEAA